MKKGIILTFIIILSLSYNVLASDVISINKSAYSSGCFGSCGGKGSNYDYRNINDGYISDSLTNDTHVWIASTSTGAWLYIDLNDSYSIDEINIYDEHGSNAFLDREPLFNINYSTDNITWTTLVSGVSLQNGARDNRTWTSSQNFSLFAARYIRLDAVGGESNGARIAELSIHGSAISLTNLNCTSCNPPLGDSIPPYETDDTTPTFTFLTINTSCRISDLNNNYTTMGSTRDCDYGQSRIDHTCTLTTQDAIINYNMTIYISCNYSENSTAQNAISMLVSSLESSNSTEAIQQGIENSVIGTGATIYSDQKVYLRMLNGSTFTNTVDKVAVYGNQRWIFNYENTTALGGMFNLTPVVYVLDMKNMSIKAIRANVTALINSTKI